METHQRCKGALRQGHCPDRDQSTYEERFEQQHGRLLGRDIRELLCARLHLARGVAQLMRINTAGSDLRPHVLLAKTPSIGRIVRFSTGFIYVTSGIHHNPKVTFRIKASRGNSHWW